MDYGRKRRRRDFLAPLSLYRRLKVEKTKSLTILGTQVSDSAHITSSPLEEPSVQQSPMVTLATLG